MWHDVNHWYKPNLPPVENCPLILWVEVGIWYLGPVEGHYSKGEFVCDKQPMAHMPIITNEHVTAWGYKRFRGRKDSRAQ